MIISKALVLDVDQLELLVLYNSQSIGSRVD
jgi:hypothetical protein